MANDLINHNYLGIVLARTFSGDLPPEPKSRTDRLRSLGLRSCAEGQKRAAMPQNPVPGATGEKPIPKNVATTIGSRPALVEMVIALLPRRDIAINTLTYFDGSYDGNLVRNIPIRWKGKN